MKKKFGLGKRADEKYYILISLILGIMVLALSLYFIYHEYFTEDDLNYEQCRESVLLRANLPSVNKYGVNWADFKDEFPLKCETQVITIDKNTENPRQLIADTIDSCWYLFGKGEYIIFPTPTALTVDTFCVPCARIHFDKSVVEDYMGSNAINLKDISKSVNGTYSDKFEVGSNWWIIYTEVKYPSLFDSSQGDLLIFFQQRTSPQKEYFSEIIFFQEGQENPEPFAELEKIYKNKGIGKFCEKFDGVPA